MSTRNQGLLVYPATGGLDTTKASTLLEPGQLVRAENIEYDTSGARKKRLGTTRYNSTAVTEGGVGVAFTAVADYWRHGTSLSPTQKFVATAGTQILKDDGDGAWDQLQSGWGTESSRANIAIAQGFAVFSNSNNDTPRTWNQSAVADLTSSGNPKFEACVYHLRRLFTIGETTSTAGGDGNPSRSTFSAAGDITDFTGGDTGNFIFDEDDGDRLVGISRPFHNRLYYFKGPNGGSIHELTGATASAFARNKIHSGVPCVSHAGIVTTANDIYWLSRYGIHSLATTVNYGDTEEKFLSRPIQTTFRGLNYSRLSQAVGFYHLQRNIVGWAVPNGSSTTNDLLLVYNYALGQWSTWDFSGFDAAVPVSMLTPSTVVPRLYVAGYDGFLRAGDQTTLTDDNGSAYTARITTPVLGKFGDANELHEKQYYSVTTFFRPKGDYNASLTVTVDRRNQSANVSMAGGADTLG